jgi:pimeloyl-ACP methyl ester carboxylesterase
MDPDDVHLEASADLVAADVAAAGLTGIVLVGHSLGGASLPAIAARLGDRVDELVFLGALVVADGQTAFSGLSPDELAERMRRLNITTGARTELDPETHRALLCNDMDEEQTAEVLARVGPDSLNFFIEEVRWTPEVAALPRHYVRLSQDRAVPPPVADQMIARLGPGTRVHEIDAGHEVMITRPDALAALLCSL